MQFPQKLTSNKTLFTLTKNLMLIFILFNLAIAQTTNEWENPNIVGKNKESPHCTNYPYTTIKQALKNDSDLYLC